MLHSFSELSDDSRIWIYQSSREFSSEESKEIKTLISEFLTQWNAHGSALKSGYDFPYNRFLIIAVEEGKENQNASGCSIDASVSFVQSLEKKYNVDLLDKMNVTYKKGEKIDYLPLKEFKKLAKSKEIDRNTVVFNNLVTNKEEYISFWEVPAGESWHARFIK